MMPVVELLLLSVVAVAPRQSLTDVPEKRIKEVSQYLVSIFVIL